MLAALARAPNLAQSPQLRMAVDGALPLTTPQQQAQVQQFAEQRFAVHGPRLLAARPELLRGALSASRYADLPTLSRQSPSCLAELQAELAAANAGPATD